MKTAPNGKMPAIIILEIENKWSTLDRLLQQIRNKHTMSTGEINREIKRTQQLDAYTKLGLELDVEFDQYGQVDRMAK